MADKWLGIDVGGANIKLATAGGWARSTPFPLWKQPELLARELAELVRAAPVAEGLAVTMTGELADCFQTRAAGVVAIVGSVENAARMAAGDSLSRAPVVRYWSNAGGWRTADQILREPLLGAASNWQGLATWVARSWPCRNGLLLDMGSTTTDLIRFSDSGVATSARSDLDRLRSGELVYLGGRRTPLAMLTPELPVRGAQIRVAAEMFATTLDLGLVLKLIPEDESDLETANGRPATRQAALDRVARQFCSDVTETSEADLVAACAHWRNVALRTISGALTRLFPAKKPAEAQSTGTPAADASVCDTVILGGSGEWLVEPILATHPATRTSRRVSLGEVLPVGCSEAACAYALARMAEDLDPA